jgi:hypothetical protein
MRRRSRVVLLALPVIALLVTVQDHGARELRVVLAPRR